MKFCCGCDQPPGYDKLRDDPVWAKHWYDTMAHKDAEGFVICGEHGQRRVAWRSLPTISTPNGDTFDYSLSRYSPLQIERFLITGEIPARKLAKVEAGSEDRRDNRDPAAVWAIEKHRRDEDRYAI